MTSTVVDWLPVFIDETACKIITESLNFCIINKHLRVNTYVIMLTHLHAILFDSEFDPERLKRTLDDMRKFTGRNCWIMQHNICQRRSPNVFRNMPAKIVNDGSGSRRSIPWGFFRMTSGDRKLTICITIRVVKDWCETRKTGDFLLHGIG